MEKAELILDPIRTKRMNKNKIIDYGKKFYYKLSIIQKA